jgi:hypothetical protein
MDLHKRVRDDCFVPVMIWVFGLLNGTQQTAFTMTFPMVKLVLKNLASRGLYRLEDLAPVYAVLSVDAFHTLLLSCAMQSSLSSGTLICIKGTDIFQSVVAVGEARPIIRKLKRLRLEIVGADASTDLMCPPPHQPSLL